MAGDFHTTKEKWGLTERAGFGKDARRIVIRSKICRINGVGNARRGSIIEIRYSDLMYEHMVPLVLCSTTAGLFIHHQAHCWPMTWIEKSRKIG